MKSALRQKKSNLRLGEVALRAENVSLRVECNEKSALRMRRTFSAFRGWAVWFGMQVAYRYHAI